jgi:hypothetical protein
MGIATLGPFLFIGGGYTSEVGKWRKYSSAITTGLSYFIFNTF